MPRPGPLAVPGGVGESERGPGLRDEVLATAILDRLLHHCEVVSVNGPGYRLKNRFAAVNRDSGTT